MLVLSTKEQILVPSIPLPNDFPFIFICLYQLLACSPRTYISTSALTQELVFQIAATLALKILFNVLTDR
jgi:hypothetical protein